MDKYSDQAAGLRRYSTNKGNAGSIPGKKAVCCLAVASGKGGVGKTFVSVNLAVALQRLGKQVLMVDADLGLANADIVFGVTPKYTLQDALFMGRSFDEVVCKTPYGVHLLGASSGTKEMVSMGAARISMLINELLRFANNYDVLLFDCAAGIDQNVTAFLSAAPQAIIVATPQATSIMDAYALLKIIHQDKLTEQVGLIVNMSKQESQGQKVLETLTRVAHNYLSNCNVDLLGIVPQSAAVSQALQKRRPLLDFDEDDPAAVRIKEIAKSILQKRRGNTQLGEQQAAKLLNSLMKA